MSSDNSQQATGNSDGPSTSARRSSERQLAIALVEAEIVAQSRLKTLLNELEEGQSILEAVVESQLATEEQITAALAKKYRLPHMRLAGVSIPEEVFRLVPEEMAYAHHCIPVRLDRGRLTLAMYNPLDIAPVNHLEFEKNLKVRIVISSRSEVLRVIEQHYGLEGTLSQFMRSVPESETAALAPAAQSYNLDAMTKGLNEESTPVRKLSNLVLADAVKLEASDVHIEPLANRVKVRYRIDGVIQEHLSLPKWVQSALVSRFKAIAEMDIAQRRRPQDGRLNLVYESRTIDLRISTLPTHFGEKVVLRILDPEKAIPGLEDLGLTGWNLERVTEALKARQGLILTTGPTGGGKTSTLYAAIQNLHSSDKNIVTVEDPIELQMTGVNQVQVNNTAGLTFPNALRSILRQDPDIVMIGEIRDKETAQIAFQAAQTGHLVLSTVHTNDAVGTLTRVSELGVEPFLVAECTLVIMAQRLARRNCEHCRVAFTPEEEALKDLGLSAGSFPFLHGAGCPRCRGTGYRGRIGVFEVLAMHPNIAELLVRGATKKEIAQAASRAGMTSLVQDGVRKIREGVTTPEEVVREIGTYEGVHEESLPPCPDCGDPLEPDLAVCPSCNADLKTSCPGCGEDLNPEWTRCPHCRTDVDAEHVPDQADAFKETVREMTKSVKAVTRDAFSENVQAIQIPPGAATPAEPARAPEPPVAGATRAPPVEPSAAAGADESSSQVPVSLPDLPDELTDILVPDGSFRILLVDDDPVFLRLLFLLLRRFKFKAEAEAAVDGKEALEKLKARAPHLIILDYMLPEMSGLELLETIRTDLATAFIPVVMVTGSASDSTRETAEGLGVDGFLRKPVNARELESVVASIMGKVYGI